jgi:hypothetical protein
MLNLALNNAVLLGIAVLIGMAAGRWIFSRRPISTTRKPEDPPRP